MRKSRAFELLERCECCRAFFAMYPRATGPPLRLEIGSSKGGHPVASVMRSFIIREEPPNTNSLYLAEVCNGSADDKWD